jgi:hypothetical protein
LGDGYIGSCGPAAHTSQPQSDGFWQRNFGNATGWANFGHSLGSYGAIGTVGFAATSFAGPETWPVTVPGMTISTGVSATGGGIEMVAGIVGNDEYHRQHGLLTLVLSGTGLSLYSEASPLVQAGAGIFRSGLSQLFG